MIIDLAERELISRNTSRETLVAILRRRARHQAEQVAYTFLHDGSNDRTELTYAALDIRARAVAAQLQRTGAQGERVLLLYPPGLEFISAFFGCLYAGAIAVPAYPPNPTRLERTMGRLGAITADAQPGAALTTAMIAAAAEKLLAQNTDFPALRWIATDALHDEAADEWRMPEIDSDTLAFLQYTSGSTGSPRGVIVSHGNLVHNQRMIEQAFGHSGQTTVVGWLPTYHDMGLIGNVLQPLYLGVPCILMSPMAFLQSPIRWLQAISDYRATTSGGPNFAYDLCTRKITAEQRASLDLSSWQVAFNGAEPVRHETLERFAATFAACGFRKETFYPCYGLAEATLLVSGGWAGEPPTLCPVQDQALAQHRVVPASAEADGASVLVGSGHAWLGQHIRIVEPETGRLCRPDQVGEIWVAGPSVTMGYWNRPHETRQTFGAYLNDIAEPGLSGPFLRTGDLGFVHDGNLFVTGRLKDLIIIRGRNYYPQDIEQAVERCHTALRPGCAAAFSVEVAGQERLVIVQEVDRQQRNSIDTEAVIQTIRAAVAEQHDLYAYAVVLLQPGSIFKTSSGKIQRHACRAGFLAGTLEAIGSSVHDDTAPLEAPPGIARADILAAAPAARHALIQTYLQQQIARLLNLPAEQIAPERPLNQCGLDSLMGTELQYRIEADLGVELPIVALLQDAPIAALADRLLEQLAAPGLRPIQAQDTPPGTPYPLSYAQQSLWFMDQLAHESRTNILACAMRVVSELDLPTLQRAVDQVVDRHAALRTIFTSEHGKPVQRIQPDLPITVEQIDAGAWEAGELQQRLSEAAYQPFTLAEGPLFRVRIYTRAPAEHYLVLALPHVIADFRSLVRIMYELGLCYTAALNGQPAQLAALPLAYADYVRWEALALGGAEGVRLWTYWREQLANAPTTLNLPADHPRPALQTYRGASVAFTLNSVRTRRLKALAETQGATLYMTVLAAFQALLYHYTRQDDFLIGSPMAGRTRAEFAHLAGPFARPVVLRADVSGDPAFVALLERTRQTVLNAIAHQDMPFSLLVERLQPTRDASRSPLFQVLFNFLSLPPGTERSLAAYGLGIPGVRTTLGALELESVGLEQPMDQFDLSLLVAELDDGCAAALHYNADLFEPATAERIAGDFQRLLDGLAARPEQRLSALLSDIPKLKLPIVVSATFTAEPLTEALAFWATQIAMPAEVQFAPYNQVFQQLLDPLSLMRTNRDGCNIVLLRLEDWAAMGLGPDALQQHVQEFIDALHVATQQSAAVYLLGVCPASPAAAANPALRAALEQAEQLVIAQAAHLNGVYLLDSAAAITRYRVQEVHDPYTDKVGHIPFTPAFFTALAGTIARALYTLRRPPYKVIAVDCDQTLWSGVCGEDGPDGVRIDAPRLALQRFLLKQYHEGMLLCLCTKNNEADVLATFQAHPDMPLKLEHFTARQINWQPKSESLARLAGELQLSLESFIFLDDSALECAEVQSRCPAVLALQLPAEPAEIAAFLDHIWAFDRVRVTEDDRRRAEVYAQNRQRDSLRAAYPTLEAFLGALDLAIELSPVTEHQLARVAELTQRTNQFNLTAIRRTESQLAQLLASGYCCWVVDVRDRFGTYGLVGAVIARPAGGVLEIDTFLLSCRVLGRRVEDVVLERLAEEARARGWAQIALTYRPTPKNAPARQFVARLAAPVSAAEDGSLTYILPAGGPLLQSAGQTEQFVGESAGPAYQPAEPVALASEAVASRQNDGPLLRRIALELADAGRIMQAIRAQKQPQTHQGGDYVAPRNEIEAVVAAIWCELLGIVQVSIDADFFALGGHSLLATQMLSRIRDAFGVELPLKVMFVDSFSVADVAQVITEYQLDQADPDRLALVLDRLETLSDEELSLLLEANQF